MQPVCGCCPRKSTAYQNQLWDWSQEPGGYYGSFQYTDSTIWRFCHVERKLYSSRLCSLHCLQIFTLWKIWGDSQCHQETRLPMLANVIVQLDFPPLCGTKNSSHFCSSTKPLICCSLAQKYLMRVFSVSIKVLRPWTDPKWKPLANHYPPWRVAFDAAPPPGCKPMMRLVCLIKVFHPCLPDIPNWRWSFNGENRLSICYCNRKSQAWLESILDLFVLIKSRKAY